jgi:hypothetical protein
MFLSVASRITMSSPAYRGSPFSVCLGAIYAYLETRNFQMEIPFRDI